MKVGLYGGSFNPVHHGHLITAQRAAEIRSLDKIILMPCYISPLRQGVSIVPGEKRMEMLLRATENMPLFEISDFELNRGGVSYTIDTVKFLREKYSEIELLIGYDNFAIFDKWKRPAELLEMTQLVVLRRKMQTEIPITHKFAGKAVFIETPFIDISSTEIRERLSEEKSIAFLTPEKVIKYINRFGLYK